MRVVAILCGRFHPFHKGHLSSFNQLCKTFGKENTFIGFSKKVEFPDSPFSVEDRVKMAMCLGVPRQNILAIKNPYKSQEYINQLKLNPNNTVLTYAVSQKDMQGDNPRFTFENKNWMQPYPKDGNNLNPITKNAYVVITQTVSFNILNNTIQNASDIRNKYPNCDDNNRNLIVQELYGNYSNYIKPLFDEKLILKLKEHKAFQVKKLVEFIESSKSLLPTATIEQKEKINRIIKEAYNQIVDNKTTESLTPLDLYPSKEELASEKGNEVWWRGKLFGITTGYKNNRVYFKMNSKKHGSNSSIGSLPIDLVSIRKKI